MKSWLSGWMAIVLLIAMFPLSPARVLAASALTVTMSNPSAVAGDKTDINVAYTNSAVLSLNLGALDFILPSGITATTSDQINGVNLTPSQILDGGQRVRLSGLGLALLSTTTTLSLKQKTLPASGNYDFQAKAYGLNLTVISTTPLDTQAATLNVGALTLALASVNVTNNPGSSDTVAVGGVKTGDIIKIYNPDNSLKTQLTAQSDGTLTVPLALTPAGGTIYVSQTRGGIESAKLSVVYLAEIVPPILLTSVYVNNASGNSDTVTVSNLSPGDSFRIYETLTATVPEKTSNPVASGQTSVSASATLAPLGGNLYVARVRNGLESTRTVVPYAAEVVAALTNDLVAINNLTGNSDQVTVTGLTQNDIVRVYATDGTLLQSLTANSAGTAQGTVALTPGGGTVNLTLVRNGVESLALPVVYLAETVESLLSSDITITNSSNDTDKVSVKGLQDGDRIRLQVGTATPITSSPASGGIVDIPATLLPNGGSVTLSILRNTIEGPRLTLVYNPEQVDAPSASQLTATNNSGDSDTVAVTGLQAGDVAIVYDAPSGGTELGRATVGSSATSVTVPVKLTAKGGTAYVAILRHTITSDRTAVVYNSETVAAPPVNTITVANNPFATDTVTVSGLQAGDAIHVYSADGSTQLGSALATGSGSTYSASLGSLSLTPGGGSVQVSIIRNTIESMKTNVSYNAEFVPAPASTSIAVTNNTGSSDQIAVAGLQAGDKVRIYRSGQAVVEADATAGAGGTYSASSPIALTATGGTLGVSIVRNTIESAATSVSYSAEIANFTGSVSVVNAEGGLDEFVLTNMTPNTTVTVYPQANGAGTPLATNGVVGADGRYQLQTTLLSEGGTLSFSFTAPGFGLNGPNNVTYGPEPVSPPAAGNITPVNNTGSGDTVTVTGLTSGDAVTIYAVDTDGTRGAQLGSGTAGASGSTGAIALTSPLVPGGGTIAATVTRNGRTSAETRVTYPSEVVNPPALADISVTNGAATANDSVTVNGLTVGDTIKVNSYAAGSTTPIATVTTPAATGTSLTANLALAPAGGYVTVAITRNTVTSQATTANYGAETVPPPAAENIVVDNGTGTAQDTVTVNNLQNGDYVTVVSYNTANTQIDQQQFQASGGSAGGSVILTANGGFVAVSIQRYSTNGTDGVSSSATRVPYNAETVAAPDPNDIAVTNNTGSGDTVVVNGLQSGDTVRVYNANGSQQLGTASANGSGTATVDVTLVPAGGSVRVTVIRNTIESPAVQVSYMSETVPAPAVNDVAVVNASGTSSDTVTVVGLQSGDIVTVTEDGTTRTGTVTGGTSVQVAFPLIPTGGIVQVSITRAGVSSQPTNVPYGAEVIPALSAADITVSNVSNTGGAVDTVTVGGVTAGDIIHVYDSSNAQIGVQTSTGGTVVVIIPSNLNAAGGSLYVARERSGLLSSSVAVTYGAETVEPIDASQVSAVNAVGDGDSLNVRGLNAGESVRVYRANGELAGAADYASGTTTVSLVIAPAGETFSLVRVRGGVESSRVAFAAGAETVPMVAAGNVVVVNNTGNQDTVTVTVDASGVQSGDVYVVYDANLTVLGRSDVGNDGAFTIPVTLQPEGGTVRVALERRGVAGLTTSINYDAEAAAPGSGPAVGDISVTNDEGAQDPVVVDNVTAGDIVVVRGANGVELNRATASADGSVTVLVDLDDNGGGTVLVSIIRDGSESARTSAAYDAYDPAQPAAPRAAQVSVVRSPDPNEEDVVTVTGLEEADIVEFFDDENASLGTEVANDTGTAVLRTLRLKSYASTLKLTVQRNSVTSGPVSVSYPAENSGVTAPPSANITVNNAAGTANDTVTVAGVQSGDQIRVYNANGTTLLGEVTAAGTSAVVPVQLGASAGSVRVSIVRGGVQSTSTQKPYAAEPVVTPSPAAADITVTNAAGTASDSVTLLGVQSGDIVKVYAAGGTSELGERTATGTSVTVPVALSAGGGTVEVSVVRGGYESARTPKTYGAEQTPTSEAPTAASITVNNEAGTTSDTVAVTNVQSGDIVRVYDGNGSTLLGQVTSTGTSATVPVSLDPEGGSVTVTVQRAGTLESARSAVKTYAAEPSPEPPAPGNITVTNGTGTTSDKIVVVEDVQAGDLVRVYDGATNALLGQQSAAGTSVTIPVELNADGGSVIVTIVRGGVESDPTPKTYPAEPAPQAPNAPTSTNVTVVNNAGPADTVEVRAVQSGDIVRVYAADGTTLLGQHTSTGTSTVVSVTLDNTDRSVIIRIERAGQVGAPSAPISYAAEPAPQGPTPPTDTNVTVTNNYGPADTVEVRGIQSGDIVRVYAADGTTLLGRHTSTGTSATVSVTLSAAAGDVRISIERNGTEGDLSALIDYLAEQAPQPAAPPSTDDVTIVNNVGTTSDTVEVRGIQAGDIVRVYAADGTTLLGQRTSAGTDATVPVALGASAGNVRISIERSGAAEGNLSALLPYDAETAPQAPAAPASGTVTATNNEGAGDTVQFVDTSALQTNDIVRVYEAGSTTLLGQATYTGGASLQIPVTLTVAQGTVDVTISRGGLESSPLAVSYDAETVPPLDTANISVVNNADGSGVVTIGGLLAGDTVTLTNAGAPLGSATATADGSITVDVSSGLAAGGGAFDAVRSRGGVDSTSVSVTYDPAPTATDVSLTRSQITFNATDATSGVVTVSGLTSGDTVTVTDATGNPLTPVVETDGTATIPVTLSPNGGILQVYVTRGSDNSAPVSIAYEAAPPTAPDAPVASDIEAVNNVGASDTVTVNGVQAGDLITVYNATGSSVLARATATGSSIEIPLTLPTATASDIQVSITRNNLESATTTTGYPAEAAPQAPNAPGTVTVTNNAGTADTVVVGNVQAGDTVTVYASPGSAILGQVTASATGPVTVNVTLNAAGGSVDVTLTRNNLESARTNETYPAESATVTGPTAAQVQINNEPGSDDTVVVGGVQAGDLVIIYAEDGTTVLGQEIVPDGETSVTIGVTLDPLGDGIEVVVSRGGVRSTPTSKTYGAEDSTLPGPDAGAIIVTNNPGASDTVQVDDVQVGDLVIVYAADGTTVLGQERVPAGSTGSVTIGVTLNTAAGSVRVGIVRGTLTSAKTPKNYVAEPTSVTAPAEGEITVANNAGSGDTVTVSGVQNGDIVTVYAANGTTVLGQQTATADGSVIVNVVLDPTGSSVRVGITRGTLQSARTPKTYDPEPASAPGPDAGQVEVNNNLGPQDTVVVSDVQAGDVVTVYAANGTTVLNRVTATTAGTLTVPVTLPSGETSVRVTIARGGVESEPTSKTYGSEPNTLAAPAASDITVANNTGSSDTVTLRNLQPGDTITVYAANGTTILDRITVGSDPATWVVPVTLTPAGGSVQVTITRGGVESSPTPVNYGAESSNVPAPANGSVQVVNNGAAGSSVIVSGVQPGDVVTIYAANGTTIIGRGQVAPGASSISIPVSLNEAGGSIQVNLTRGTTSGPLTPVSYPARVEPGTGTPGDPGTGTPGDPGTPAAPANPVTPETVNPVTPETTGDGEELDVEGRIVTLTNRGPRSFNDIKGYWAQSAIERLASLGILDGRPDGSFGPRETLTRAQFTKMVAMLLGITSQTKPVFSDVPANRWYSASIQGAFEEGVVKGYVDGTFKPDEPVSREEMAKILTDAMLWLNADVFAEAPDYTSAQAFRDYGRIGNWAKEPVSRMLEEGILLGKTNGILDPKGDATRAEAAAVLVRLIERMSDNFTE
ncbi:hypothetical protein CDO73_04350 [Saccharibacillus sp. O23]|uniref:S-layer homology domain-containing protein n=1 Tax=Saccharibacillus sp. O23 TaxID=2009338 RepID=UPI000B4E233F|nr:S-layer homology domain-containing protein [Saccharibacillus sp. O23]OWR31720.1 hypothetical protein CDO73_04350 [Saccharibacillus sp. O23]